MTTIEIILTILFSLDFIFIVLEIVMLYRNRNYIERHNYILTKEEKIYLINVSKLFYKGEIKYIRKSLGLSSFVINGFLYDNLTLVLSDNTFVYLPIMNEKLSFWGMICNKDYTPEELGLDL